jgi:hypothetical protein
MKDFCLCLCVMHVLRFFKICVTDLVKYLIHGYDLNMEYRTIVDYDRDDAAM